jgi:hypothetical protein
MKTKLRFLGIFLLILVFPLQAQDESKSAEFNLGTDLTSRYIWRGIPLSSTPALQPYAEISKKGFTFGAWGSYTIAPEPFQEVDLYMSYTKGAFTFTLYDYYIPVEAGGYINDYFNWNQAATAHTLEAVIHVSDIPNLPLSITAGVILYGDDLNAEGKQNFSSYIEPAYNFSVGKTKLNIFAGLTLAEGLYADQFTFVNTGISAKKDIEITEKFKLPISTAFVLNPDAGDVFLVLTITL